MKKFFAMILALAMVMTMATTAFAGDAKNVQSANIPVTGTYSADEYKPEVISADVKWDEMEFTYSAAGSKVWNATTHEYEESSGAGWAKETKNITIVNHSNVAIKASFVFKANTADFAGLTGTFGKDNMTLKSAVGTVYENAPEDTTTFAPSGATLTTTDTDVNLGTIVVTIAKNAE